MWARSIGRHMYFGGLFNLDKWDSRALYAVFDDIEWKYFPAKKQLLGAQWEFELSDKYRRKKTVHYGLPAIYCMNEDNYAQLAIDPMIKWIRANNSIVKIHNKIY